MNTQDFSILFARNLFLPEDLGGNRYPFDVMRRLGRRGHPVTVVTPRLHGRIPRLDNVRYRLYPIDRSNPGISHVTNVAAATAALRHERGAHAVAISGSYDAALALGLAGVAPSTPLVFLFHSEFYSEWVQALGSGPRALACRAIRAYMAAIERRVFDLSARIVAVSRFSAGQIESRAPAAARKVRQVPTGVDTQFFVPAERGQARAALGLSVDEPLIIGVGRLAAVKQFDRLIGGFAAASASGLRARLAILGDGPERARLERLIELYGVGERVRLVGYCDPQGLRAWMQAADLEVCSSAFENFSLAILEGMACGTPVLGTPGGGTPELVGPISPELVLADDSAASIADALPRLLRNPDYLLDLGRQARATTVERYDWQSVTEQLEAVCAEVRAV